MTKAIAKRDPRDIQLTGFTLTGTGIISDGKATIDDWLAMGQFIERAEGAVQWWIGDWLNYGAGRPEWGDKYEQAISIFNKPYGTLSQYKWVAAAIEFCDRSQILPWTHHKVLASQPPAVRRELLEAAEPDAPDKPPKLSVVDLKKEVKRLNKERDTPTLPKGQYRVLYADPPWQYSDDRLGDIGAAVSQYSTLSTDCICAIHKSGRSVQDVSAKDAVLFLWCTAPLVPDAIRVMAAWGFGYKSQYIWNKVLTYNGHYNAVGHELLLIGVKGSCPPDEATLSDSVVTIERTEHSAKPDSFYVIIEEMYTQGPYLELFARRKRDGWESWGLEVQA